MPTPPTKPRKPGAYSVAGAWLCHPGRVREANEDACVIGSTVTGRTRDVPAKLALDGESWLVAVSDGIGGHRAGAEASHEVATSLAQSARHTPSGIRDTLQRVNRRLCDRGRRDPECAAMGATVAGMACGGKGLFAFSVGDSRVYKHARQRLTQVTRDDSEAEELMRAGLLPRDGSVRPGFMHALTQAIGGRDYIVEIKPHLYPLSVASRARFLICTDGVTDMLAPSVIEEILAQESDPAAAVALLFHLAMDAGGVDNITLALLDVEKSGL